MSLARRRFGARLDATSDMAEIFELVKGSVRRTLGLDRSGLMLAFFTPPPDAATGAALALDGNVICLNKKLLEDMRAGSPRAFPSFCYFALLHEYLRMAGYADEVERLTVVYTVCLANLGVDHPATHMAASLPQAFGEKGLAFYGATEGMGGFEVAPNFDYSNVTYIQ